MSSKRKIMAFMTLLAQQLHHAVTNFHRFFVLLAFEDPGNEIHL